MPVVCNNNRAALDVRRMAIVLPSGRDVTPTEFERMCGKGASKKWKASLRIDKGGCACLDDAAAGPYAASPAHTLTAMGVSVVEMTLCGPVQQSVRVAGQPFA